MAAMLLSDASTVNNDSVLACGHEDRVRSFVNARDDENVRDARFAHFREGSRQRVVGHVGC
jgi:hypothetical protein